MRANCEARPLIRQHALVDLGDGVDAAQPHGDAEFVADDVDRLGDAGLAAGAEAVGEGAADHAGFGAEGEGAHHILAERMPPSNMISICEPTASAISGNTSIDDGAPSS